MLATSTTRLGSKSKMGKWSLVYMSPVEWADNYRENKNRPSARFFSGTERLPIFNSMTTDQEIIKGLRSTCNWHEKNMLRLEAEVAKLKADKFALYLENERLKEEVEDVWDAFLDALAIN